MLFILLTYSFKKSFDCMYAFCYCFRPRCIIDESPLRTLWDKLGTKSYCGRRRGD
jgi:hypothetical protein